MPRHGAAGILIAILFGCTSKPPEDDPAGMPAGGASAGPAGGSSAGSQGGAGGGSPVSGAPMAQPGGTAYVRFCHAVNDGTAPATVTLELGGQRFEVAAGQCAPAVGKACAAVPSGVSMARTQLPSGESYTRPLALVADTAYMVWGYDVEIDGKRAIRPHAYTLESQQDCAGLDFREADLRIGPPLELEPFRADGFTFAKPRGFVRKDTDRPRTYVFESPDPNAEIRRFQITYFGRVPASQVPLGDVFRKAVTDRKLKLLTAIDGDIAYDAATADTGVPGPDRYVHLMYLSHYDLLGTPVAIAGAFAGLGPSAYDLFTAEFAFSSPFVATYHALDYVLKSIAWGIAVPPDEIPAAELPGTWLSKRLENADNSYDLNGNFLGSRTESSEFKITFDAAGNYKLDTMAALFCSGSPLAPCLFQGLGSTSSRGRYVADGGILILSPFRCEGRTVAAGAMPQATTAPCFQDSIPVTLRMKRGDKGSLRMGGLGMNPIAADEQQLRGPIRQDGPPGNWDVPYIDPYTKDPASGRPATDTFNACGLTEAEPNDKPASATPYRLGEDVVACAPTYDDPDYYELTAPAGDKPGYFEAAVEDTGQGTVKAMVDVSASNAEIIHDVLAPTADTTTPGAPLYFFWAGSPGQKYRVRIMHNGFRNKMFQYRFNATFRVADDAFEPNDQPEQAKPIALGTPVTALLMSGPIRSVVYGLAMNSHYTQDKDWYTLQLAAGNTTVSVEDVPSDTVVGVSVIDPAGNRRTVARGILDGKPGMPIRQTFSAATAGSYRLVVESESFPSAGGQGQARHQVPAHYFRPYRLLVTQP